MEEKYYAHSLLNEPPEKWQGLEDHLKNVAVMAQGFAEELEAGEWAYLAGLWHDIGKYFSEFHGKLAILNDQDSHIKARLGRLDHSEARTQRRRHAL